MQIVCLVVQRRVDDMIYLFRYTGLHGELGTFSPNHTSKSDDHVFIVDSLPSAVVLHSCSF